MCSFSKAYCVVKAVNGLEMQRACWIPTLYKLPVNAIASALLKNNISTSIHQLLLLTLPSSLFITLGLGSSTAQIYPEDGSVLKEWKHFGQYRGGIIPG